MRQVFNTDQAPSPVGPYNQSVADSKTLYVSGQIAIDPHSGQMVQTTIEEETRQVMHNVGAVLHAAGADYGDILMCTIYVRDMEDYSRINAVYADFFDEATAPARALVEVSRLPKDANIEISVIATLT